MTKAPTLILIVEDEDRIRRNLRVFLEDDGFSVVTAASAEEGLLFLDQCTPRVAIVDIRLPGMDGVAFIEKARGLCSEMRFIVYTGSVSFKPSSRLRAVGIQAEQLFRKPLMDLAVLVDAVKTQLATRG